MAAVLSGLYDDLFGLLRSDLGVYDLSDYSGTHRVDVADAGRPAGLTAPLLYLGSPTDPRTYGEPAHLGQHANTVRIPVWGYVGSTSLDGLTRLKAGLDFANEVATAIEANRFSGSYPNLAACVQVLLSIVDVFTFGPQVPEGEVVVQAELLLQYSADRGL